MDEIKILTKEEVLLKGIEFIDDVCFSGDYEDQVFDRPMEDGGKPITGLVYEKYNNGNLAHYCYYVNGIPEGDYATFYESGKLEGFKRMSKGAIIGKSFSWFEDGSIRVIAESLYGFKITYKEWNEKGELIKEKVEPTQFEKDTIKKWSEQDAE
ncbi:hypothetical protein EHV15_01985 [Paenibacillus oralis]|uniref:Uncharacterized protein n=1 Tax=Paenibacillus oralis TaxID=2490856 RepID=A0A3P3U051_9BACL|nr:hypothetical protein [Paenibacillus oralis]RRJ61883.1 hypothetical protein EHV15_01985 [Paenibacillus oralis]